MRIRVEDAAGAGRLFAIVVSSILFALYHGNFVQMPYTFLAGLIFGYVASEYSLYWSMALHIIDNCVFGDVLQYAFAVMDEGIAYGIAFALMVLFVSVSVYTLVTKRAAIVEFIRQRRTEAGNYRVAFTSIGFIVLCVCGISFACLGVRAL